MSLRKTTSKSPTVPVEDKSWSSIKRSAIDTSGCLGSLYDLSGDQIIGKVDVKTRKLKPCNPKKVECTLINGKTTESQNLLQMIGFEDDLRLSILLNLVPRTGLASLINYSSPINDYTRFLRYTYTYREENLSEDTKKARKQIKSPMPQTGATHIITGVNWGINVFIVLQLPAEAEQADAIDTTLENVKMTLHNNHDSQSSNIHDLDKLNIINMKVYSNIPFLARASSLHDIYQKIHQFKINYNDYSPIDYTLRSIQEIYQKNTDKSNNNTPLDASCSDEIEQHFLQMTISINYLETYFNENKLSVLRQHFSEQFFDMYIRWLDVKKKNIDELDRFAKLLIDCRHNYAHISQIKETLNDEQQRALKTNIDKLIKDINHLEAKERFISDLQQKQFQYWNVVRNNLDEHDNEQIVEQKLIRDDRLDRILCSTDTLNNDRSLELNQLRDQLMEEHQNNADLRLIYADFSYGPFKLPNIIILPRAKGMENRNISPRPIEPLISAISSSSPSDEIINILLLGESGVGKSTFINAFVNYITYKTLQEAELNKPVVIIPVSFITTVGTNFKEKMVKFGDSDRTDNEDFDHPGQSVTQHCKSYVFDLNCIIKKKLCIIDTPGFGDTRGLDQDDRNMQHILEYINNLTHLNAICFLLKPNVARLNNYFRTCVSQLLGLLGPNARQNIIFCFTNSRCTFYSPGDTAPLLRVLLDSFPVKDIPFTKTNTFCFDSESFRYLVALKNSIIFSELDRNEYEKSWTISATESNRLIDYICKNQTAYYLNNKWKSTQHAQIEIIHMIHPILETIRNTLRNIILLRMKSENTSIKLIAKGIDGPTTVCLSCKTDLILVAKFLIMPNDLHGRLNKCLRCKCAPDKHILIDYTLRYEASSNPVNHDENEMIDQISLLLNTTVEFAHFLKSTDYSSKDDPYLVGLRHMIQKETQICLENKTNQSNTMLLEELKKLKNKYEYRINEMKPNRNNIELPVIYERIKVTKNYPDVHEQMNAVREGQENMMKYYEHQISNDPTDTPEYMDTSF